MIHRSDLPATLREALEPGEQVLWADRPIAWRLAIRKFPFFVIGALMLALGVYALSFLARTDVGKSPVNHAIVWPMLIFLALGFCVPCAIGLAAATMPFLRAWTASNTIYAITDRRVLIVVAPRLGGGSSVFSFRSGEITRVTSTNIGGRVGDIILWRGPINYSALAATPQSVALSDYRIECGLWAVPNPDTPADLVQRLHQKPEQLI